MAGTRTDPETGSQPAKRRRRVPGWGIVARHPRIASLLGLLLVGLILFVLVWFQPQKLFLNQRVNEALPSTAPAAAPSGPFSTSPPHSPAPGSPPPPTGPVTLASGAFRSLEHGTTGKALLVRLADGSRYLRFENLNTSNGP